MASKHMGLSISDFVRLPLESDIDPDRAGQLVDFLRSDSLKTRRSPLYYYFYSNIFPDPYSKLYVVEEHYSGRN